MSVTATVEESVPFGHGWNTYVLLTDGVSKERLSFQNAGTVASLKPQILAVIAQRDVAGKLPVIPPGTLIDLTPDPVIPPTADEIARGKWVTARIAVQQCQRGLAEKIAGFDQARVDQAMKDRDALYDPSFEDMV